MAFQAIYSQVVEAQSSLSQIDASIISTLCKEIKVIFDKVKRYQVADFHLPADLKNNSTRENLKNEDETESKNKKKIHLPANSSKSKALWIFGAEGFTRGSRLQLHLW